MKNQKSIKILIVEDEKIVAKDIQSILAKYGYDVPDIVSTGSEALKIVDLSKPDLVLMDIKLQGAIDGIEAARLIRSQFSIPVIYLTAYADDSTLNRAITAEPFGYILKPFEDRELNTSISMALYKHKMESDLRESKQWYATTLSSIGDAVITTDTDGKISFMNHIAEKITEWRFKEIEGRPLLDIFRVKKNEDISENKNNCFSLKTVLQTSAETKLLTRNNSEIYITYTCKPIKTDQNTTVGNVLTFQDITEKKKFEQELLKTQKLEAIGILAGGIAHDFNNILTAIMGNISLAILNLDPDNKLFEILADAEKASQRAKDLTNQLLTFSRGGAPVRRATSISSIIKESAKFTVSGSNVRCQFTFENNLNLVNIDSAQIGQVIRSLVINAVQSMPDGGTVKIDAENFDIKNDTAIPLAEGNYLKITITDDGIGIKEEHINKIFDPYFSTKQRGSGLGLATSYSIIKKHDGYITVKSKLGQGTTFTIYLPVVPATEVHDKEERLPIKMEKGNILVMDDEEIVRKFLSRMLGSIGFDVDTAVNGEEAIQKFRQKMDDGSSYQLVILDVTIQGGMGGIKTMQKLREIDPGVTAVVSSGYSNDPVMAKYKSYGFAGMVAKPYKTTNIYEVIKKVLHD